MQTNSSESIKDKVVSFTKEIWNSTWGIGALLAAISAWTAGMLYV